MNERNADTKLLSIMVRGAYDLQKLRMQAGIRLVANFRAKLFNTPETSSNPEETSEPVTVSNPSEGSEPLRRRKPKSASAPTSESNPASPSAPSALSNPQQDSEPVAVSNPNTDSEPSSPSNPLDHSDDETPETKEAKKIIDQLRASYKNLTAGVARNRTLPTEKGFKGDALISSFPELVLVNSYMALERQEEQQFAQLESQLNKFKIWTDYLRKGNDCLRFDHDGKPKQPGGIQSGIGPAMAGVIISWFDPEKARHISSFWKYAGLDVAGDGRGRSRRKEHLVERDYTDKNGAQSRRMSITYDPFLKTKLMGVLAGLFIRSGSPWRQVYDDYKHRLETDPAREKVTLVEWKKRNKKGENLSNVWAPGRIDWAAKRYMVKMFLLELWLVWREMEGLPVSQPYHVAKQGRRPYAA
jgi:hypothetical protein